jgi:rhomboid family GlyGly-CTERM serine protease
MISRAERFALAGALIFVLLQGVASALPQVGAVLEYQHAALGAQPWRLLTGHWVHINWVHALINAAAWFIVARLFAQELSPARQVFVVLGAGVAISAGLALVYPQIDWYRGFSGVLHALFFAGATTWLTRTLAEPAARTLAALWLPGALAVGGWVKVLLEQPAAGTAPYATWLGATTVPQAHLLGAACGTVVGLFLALRTDSGALAGARQKREQPEQK